jgi:hypothetical protein
MDPGPWRLAEDQEPGGRSGLFNAPEIPSGAMVWDA